MTDSTGLPFNSSLNDSKSFGKALAKLPAPGSQLTVASLSGSLKGIYCAKLFEQHSRTMVIICPDSEEAQDVWNDILLLIPEERVVFLGELTRQSKSAFRTLEHTLASYAETLRTVIEDGRKIVVTDIETFLTEMPTASEISDHSMRLAKGMELAQQEFVRRLAYGGFEQQDFVSAMGEYSVRGGIVDLFPIGFDRPLRIEFFGDEIDSIREFDTLNQRSIRQLDAVGFMTSLFLDEESHEKNLMARLFDSQTILVLNQHEQILRTTEVKNLSAVFATAIEPFGRFVFPVLVQDGVVSVVKAEPQPAFNSSVAILKTSVGEMIDRGYRIYLLADSEQQAQRFEDLINTKSQDDDISLPDLEVYFSPLACGFILHDARLAVLTEHQVFNRRRIHKEPKRSTKGLSLREARQLHVGDYVVHMDKGIGRFDGFRTIRIGGGLQETAKILYADDDVLYVNLNYLGKLQKYSAEEGFTPKLSKLGSGEWDRIRSKTKRRLKDIARDLITLYAKRKMAKGFAFSPDSAWQKEMEASFMYEDTPDQAQATEDVKNDMIVPVPMDRLVCGDVGYGKTEVAVRAAFKSVIDGKQVAVLVPTTILAQQHYNTFNDRLHRYSVNVEALSRFKTLREQKGILKKLSAGQIDIVIGTHRLLSQDVTFKSLGLLIVDEEHRFGVAAKEKLRKQRENIDSLTLTATPIPRTLNFSLLGARDLSVIETPPKNRLPIITTLEQFNKDILVEGIEREMERGGQVYFVNDRITDLEMLADKIRAAVPSVRIGIAHGKMKSSELERVMMRFLEKKIDVLVTTKIVESGLDIPNANTVYINRADRFGLAELYQLRGRVGRSNIQAYAYLIVPPQSKLSRDAIKRLQAIEEFSDLGAGFQLAMRDLEIRGAGDLLGAEQSGFISEIGFELYMSTLEEAVAELKQEEFSDLFHDHTQRPKRSRPDVAMELGLDAYFPNDFIASSTERFDLYKRLYAADSDAEIQEIEDELLDRFSLLPPEAENLFVVVRLRLLASTVRFSRVLFEEPSLTLAFPPEDDEEFYSQCFQPLMTWVADHQKRVVLKQEKTQVSIVLGNVKTLDDVRSALTELVQVIQTHTSERVSQETAEAT